MSNDGRDLNPPARPPRFQFTLRSMLIFTAFVAVLCSVLFAMPDWAAALVLFPLMWSIPAILVTLVVYGNRDQRTFGIGALFPCGFSLLFPWSLQFEMANLPFPDERANRWLLVLLWTIGALNGYLCVLTRRWIDKGREAENAKTLADTQSRP